MEFRKEVAYVPATLENESKKSEDTYFVFTLRYNNIIIPFLCLGEDKDLIWLKKQNSKKP